MQSNYTVNEILEFAKRDREFIESGLDQEEFDKQYETRHGNAKEI